MRWVLDDVVIQNADMVRLERMTDNSFWMCVYRGGERVCFAIGMMGHPYIEAKVTENGLDITGELR